MKWGFDMKKIYFFFIWLLAILASGTVFAYDAEISADDAFGNKGDMLSVVFRISENDICTGSIQLEYDHDMLQLVAIEKKDALGKHSVFQNINGAKFNWLGLNTLGSGEFFEAKFLVTSDKKAICYISFERGCTNFWALDESQRNVNLPQVKAYLNGSNTNVTFMQNGTEVLNIIDESALTVKYNAYIEQADKIVTVYIAEYDNNGILSDLKCYSYNAKEITDSKAVNISQNTKCVKVMFWDKKMHPYSKYYECLKINNEK